MGKLLLGRFFAAALFIVIMSIAPNCHGQLIGKHRSWRVRRPVMQPTQSKIDSATQSLSSVHDSMANFDRLPPASGSTVTSNAHATFAVSQPYRFPTASYFQPRYPMISRLISGKLDNRKRDPAEIDSRYIGGFHQNSFNNIGIPSGDIGLRGNGLIWRPF